MATGFASTTDMESLLGDQLTAEISDLRVKESGLQRRPSNIIAAGRDFELVLDISFVRDEPNPFTPDSVDVEVRCFLEAFGTSNTSPGQTQRFEINISPKSFSGLNTNPAYQTHHQLVIPVNAGTIEAPTGKTMAELFGEDTVYKVAAHVKCWPSPKPYPKVILMSGFIEGLPLSAGEP